MALSMSEMLCTTPLAVFVIYLNATATEIGPWRSWEDTHFAYSRVEQIPGLFWRSNHQLAISMELTRWVAPFCAIVFFAFFGFAQEAQRNYRIAYLALAKRVPFLPSTSSSSKASPIGYVLLLISLVTFSSCFTPTANEISCSIANLPSHRIQFHFLPLRSRLARKILRRSTPRPSSQNVDQ